MWFWLAAAHAAPVGYWHPDDLGPLSNRFVDTSEKLRGPFEARSASAEQLAAALREYQEALDLLGSRAPAAERERLEGLQHEFQRQHAVLQQFADELIADYDTVFMSAVERAVVARGEVVQCAAELRQGPSLPGVPSRTVPNPECTGENLNASLASTVDADPALEAGLADILSRPWPTLALESAQQAPIGGGERWLSVRDLMVAGVRDRLRAIDLHDDEARDRIDAAIESGASTEALKALGPEADRIDAETAAARAALAAPILAAAEKRMAKKWAAEPATGWCANPVPLGACTGTDASRELVGRLVDDKKVKQAFGS